MELEQSHDFAPDEARERLRALGDYLSNRHGMKVQWLDDNRLEVKGKYTVATVEVTVNLDGKRVKVTGKDPGMLLRGAAKKYVAGKLEKYLDPREALSTLPRG
jgi:hypothetical protein